MADNSNYDDMPTLRTQEMLGLMQDLHSHLGEHYTIDNPEWKQGRGMAKGMLVLTTTMPTDPDAPDMNARLLRNLAMLTEMVRREFPAAIRDKVNIPGGADVNPKTGQLEYFIGNIKDRDVMLRTMKQRIEELRNPDNREALQDIARGVEDLLHKGKYAANEKRSRKDRQNAKDEMDR